MNNCEGEEKSGRGRTGAKRPDKVGVSHKEKKKHNKIRCKESYRIKRARGICIQKVNRERYEYPKISQNQEINVCVAGKLGEIFQQRIKYHAKYGRIKQRSYQNVTSR